MKAVFWPGSLTLNSYTLLQQTSQNIAFTVYSLTQEISATSGRLEAIRCHYPEFIYPEDMEGGIVSPSIPLINLIEQDGASPSEADAPHEDLPPITPYSKIECSGRGMQIQFR